mmetsp:Transcript_29909/g.74732  ORF Transcript_29909/g.74732 Transcript_29909/m.74732 type:complete len:103 (-) Transcript_29909:284-592(-)
MEAWEHGMRTDACMCLLLWTHQAIAMKAPTQVLASLRKHLIITRVATTKAQVAADLREAEIEFGADRMIDSNSTAYSASPASLEPPACGYTFLILCLVMIWP